MLPYGHQYIDDDDIDAVIKVLNSDWLTQGKEVETFEQALCAYTQGKYAVAVNSGTSALDIAVKSLCMTPGSEVITTPFTFAATSNALLYNNMKPVFADIQRDTRNIDPESIRKKITQKTRAILYVDYAGHPCDINEIKEIATEHNLYTIEDACHALGAEYHGKKVGALADISTFSFHPVKPITTGEGGAAITDDKDLADNMQMLRSHGIKRHQTSDIGSSWEYDMYTLGRNYRITDIQCALGTSQLKKLDAFIKLRNKYAALYRTLLADVPFVELPVTKDNVKHGWHIFTILLNGVDRNAFFKHMYTSEIVVNVHYKPVYRLAYYRKRIGAVFSDYPVSEDVYKQIITIPLFPSMKQSDIHNVADTIKKFN